MTQNLQKTKKILQEADALFITAGAGMGGIDIIEAPILSSTYPAASATIR